MGFGNTGASQVLEPTWLGARFHMLCCVPIQVPCYMFGSLTADGFPFLCVCHTVPHCLAPVFLPPPLVWCRPKVYGGPART